MKRKVRLQTIRFSNGEVELDSLLSEADRARIKSIDASPTISVYSVAHEGDATPSGGVAGRVLRFMAEAVKTVFSNLRSGLRVFHTHDGADGANPSRPAIGEVVGKALKTIEGKLHTVAAVWIYPQYKALADSLDISSIEADSIYLPEGSDDRQGSVSLVEKVEDITGLALSSSSNDRPAFPGARRLGPIYAFSGKPNPGATAMTLEELKAEIEEQSLSPSDLFSTTDLISDKNVRRHMSQKGQENKAQLDKLNERLTAQLDEIEGLKKTNTELQSAAAEIKAKAVQAKVKDLFENSSKERNLSDKQKAFLEDSLPDFISTVKAETEDEAGKQVNEFVTKGLERFGRIAKIIGGEEAAVDPGAPPAKPTQSPNENPMIPAEGADLVEVK